MMYLLYLLGDETIERQPPTLISDQIPGNNIVY